MSQPSSQTIEYMHHLLDKYSKDFPQHLASDLPIKPYLNVVLLTGTRGGLGANILAQLIEHKDVTRVFALNRVHADGKTSIERQADEFECHALPKSLASSPKLLLLEGDTSKEYFGLAPETFREVSESITGIILNAWLVDFSSSLAVFEPAIAGLRNIIDMALKSPQSRPPHLLFCSSVVVLQGNARLTTPLLEIEVEDPVVGQGYCESKWISEKIIAAASKQTTLTATIARLGQLTGSSSGAWKTNEWFPLVIKSSQIMGCLPMDKRFVNFIPVQPAAVAVVELMDSTINIAHIVHPQPVAADVIVRCISKSLNLPIVSQAEWFQKLAARAGPSKNPAIRLLPFLQWLKDGTGKSSSKLLSVSSINAQRGAPSLSRTAPLADQDVERWLAFWQRTGFLHGRKSVLRFERL